MPWYIPFVIFLARILDVSVGTMRVILVIRGHKYLAALFGFTESVIWLLAVSGVLRYIDDSVFAIVAYGAGFASGTLVGMSIEQKLALGEQMIRVINTDPKVDLGVHLRNMGHTVTELKGLGAVGEVEVSFLVTPRRRTSEVMQLILEICPRAFITVEDVRNTSSAFSRVPRGCTMPWRRLARFK